ncbi:MAG: hypothetical protein M3R24_39790 [Chloroflexota bacterium]|nr:hypothetical protein [Chloroflexota bacterium]
MEEPVETPQALEYQIGKERTILIEIVPLPHVVDGATVDGGLASGGDAARMIEELDAVGDTIAAVCARIERRVRQTLTASRPKEITLEFGVTLAGAAGIPFITSASVEGSFKVAATWDFSQ